MEELRKLLEATPIDEDKVRSRAEELGHLQAGAFVDKVLTIAKTRMTLTPEQLDRIRRIVASRGERR